MKKKILSFALAGSLMLGLTGCGQKSDPNPGSKKGYDEGEQYVSIWVHSIEDTDEGRAYRQSVNAFNKKYNGKYFADIEFIPRNDSGGGYTDKINASVMSGGLPDVLTVDGPNISSYAHNNIIAPLVDVTKKEKSEYLNSIIEQGTVDGKLYALGAMESSVGLYYNKDILDKAGVTEVPSTWTEFLDACQKIKDNTDAAGYCIPLNTEAPNGIQNQFSSWVWASGGSLLKDGKPSLTDNETLTKVTELFKTMYDKGYLSSGVEAMKEQDMVNEFENGRLAFMVDGISHLTTITKESPDINFDYAKMPVMDGYTGKSGMDVANWGIGIAENCEHKTEAMQFVEYLMSPEINAKLAQLANAFPGNSNAKPDYSSNDERFQKSYEFFNEGYAINEFTGAPTAEDLMRSFNEQLVLFLDGDTSSSADALSAIQGEWESVYGS